MKFRVDTFKSMMKQECGWFDEDDHSAAVLSARLSGDAANLQGVCVQKKLAFYCPLSIYISIC